MPRYFIEVAYKGTRYSGFQVQENAPTIQQEVENAYAVLHRRPVSLTGSSRTDRGVHSLQNFFHFDDAEGVHPQAAYKMNAILPGDIVVKGIYNMHPEAHSRFDAVSREYAYHIYKEKNPFLEDKAFFFPYPLDWERMEEAAALVKEQQEFHAFAKTNSGVKHHRCTIYKSGWEKGEEQLIYRIKGNRFLRGMVRLLTGSMLQVGRGKLSVTEFASFFGEGLPKSAWAAPAHGLFLKEVGYPEGFFGKSL